MNTELYQQTILDHNRKPRNFRVPQGFTHSCRGHNPLCGDDITVYVRRGEDGVLAEVAFQGNGCAISKASASMMTQELTGKKPEDVEKVWNEFHRMIRGEFDPDREANRLGKLKVFKGVCEYPVRVKCAVLAWHAIASAIRGDSSPGVTTEE